MFIRRTKTFSKANGRGLTYRLCQSLRCGSRVRQVTLLNLGVRFDVPQQRWPELLLLLESLDAGCEPLLPADLELLGVARQLADRLRKRRLAAASEPQRGAVATVELDSLEHSPSRSVGGERLALAALEELRFASILHDEGVSERDARIATALVIARMLHPSSEREAQAWLAARSATYELLGLDTSKPPSLTKLYRVGDQLWQRRKALEIGLLRRERTLFDGPRTIRFYDLTNVHYHGRPRGDLQFGRSKQKRSDCPLVTLALAVDEQGFPQRSEVLPGNVSEPGTLKRAIELLEQGVTDELRPLVVMDAGIATEANLKWLCERDYPWITVRRGSRVKPPERAADEQFSLRGGLQAKAWRLSEEGAAETEVCVWSEGRQGKEEAILKGQRQRFEKELTALHEGLSRKHCTKTYDKVVERLGRLKERYRRVASHYHIEVERAADKPAKAGRKKARKAAPRAAAVRWRRNARGEERDAVAGTSTLRTSETGWELDKIVRTYWRLTQLEATFRSLKGELGLRPVWHTKRDRIRAHLLLAVLAYHAVHLLRRRLAAQGIHWSWQTIRRRLAGWDRITSTLRTVEGRLIENRQDTRPGAEAAAIARAAGIEPQLHRQRV